jgi:amidase
VSMLWKLDACGQAELVRKREVTPRELVQAAIERIEAVDPRINAVVTPLFDRALEQASRGLPAGPFRGVPLLLKDFLCETAGDP